MYALGRRASFWVAAAVAAIALWTSGAPTVTYPLYAAQWHLSQTVTTMIFAVYPVVLVAVLIISGDISDHIGRRATMLLGLGAALVGTLLFAVAPDVGWLLAGRAFMGLGVGLSISPATAAMVEFSAPGQAKRSSSVTTAATALGLVLATVVGGGLIQYAPFPTHLNFWVLSAVIATVFGAAWFLPRHVAVGSPDRWRPRAPYIPHGLRLLFATSALAVTAAYASGALMLSLGAEIGRDLVGSDNALVTGLAISLSAATIGLVALLARGLAARTDIVWGGIATTVAMGLLLLAANERSLLIFLVAAAAMGTGYSLLFLGGLTLISANAPAHHRGGTLSAVYLVGYLMQGVVAISLGLVATTFGLGRALDVGAPVMAFLGLAALALVALTKTAAPVTDDQLSRHVAQAAAGAGTAEEPVAAAPVS
jgi:Major Facilitator Superfamily